MQSDIKSFVLLKYNIVIGPTWGNLHSLYPKEVIEKTQQRYRRGRPATGASLKEILIEELCEWEKNHVVIG